MLVTEFGVLKHLSGESIILVVRKINFNFKILLYKLDLIKNLMTAAGEEEEVGRAAAFRGQGASSAVRRRVVALA